MARIKNEIWISLACILFVSLLSVFAMPVLAEKPPEKSKSKNSKEATAKSKKDNKKSSGKLVDDGCGNYIPALPEKSDDQKSVESRKRKKNVQPDFLYRSKTRLKIEAALKEKYTFNFDSQPLKKAIKTISDDFDILIYIQKGYLEEEGILVEDPVTLVIDRKVTLGLGLRLLLEKSGLGMVVKDEMLVVTTETEIDRMLETRVYDVSKIAEKDLRPLMETLRLTVIPDTWAENGGEAEMVEMEGGVLTIRANQITHIQIVSVIQQLERLVDNVRSGKSLEPTIVRPKVNAQEKVKRETSRDSGFF